MISALDTNVLFDVLIPNPSWFKQSLVAIQRAASAGSLVICDIVYAELSAQFQTMRECDAFLAENHIRVERISREALFDGAEAWRSYRKSGGKRDRILPDFLVASHARLQASALVTRDSGFYRKHFADLVIVDPSKE